MIKYKNKLIIIVSAVFSLVSTPVWAEQIDQYTIQLKIEADGRVQVREQIDYDFQGVIRHGIVRNIPIAQSTWFGRRSIDVEIRNISRDGIDEPFTVQQSGSEKSIKIGDENTTITGKQRYTIVYTVKRALNTNEEVAELYWNAIGTDWYVPITNNALSIILPEKVTEQDVEVLCYQGSTNSPDECSSTKKNNRITARANGVIDPGEGLTVLVHFPVAAVTTPTTIQQAWWWLRDNWAVLIPIPLFVVLFIVWLSQGRDAKGKGTIIAQYDPPKNVLPTLMGSLIDTKVDLRDITAGIVRLAQQGYISITRIEQKKVFGKDYDYELELLKPLSEVPQGIEQQIAQAFFFAGNQLTLSSLKNNTAFADRLSSAKGEAYRALVQRGYFRANPNTTRLIYGIAAVALGGVLIISGRGDVLHIVTGIISGLLIIGFGWIMPATTKLGTETKQYVLGFKLFLSVTDKERFKFHNAPEKNSKQFMEYLPFAIALGVETQWADQFKDITIQNPEWYHGGYVGVIMATQFAHDLSQFSTRTQSSARSASYSNTHSAGSVGGGFGGGGGHSW